MYDLLFLATLMILHWIADFVLQTQWQASNKSKNLWALSSHVLTYTGVFFVGLIVLYFLILIPLLISWSTVWTIVSIIPYKIVFYYVVLNGVLHFVTDFFTSKWTRALYPKAYMTQDWHNFFVVIGFDQLIHILTLGITFSFFFQ